MLKFHYSLFRKLGNVGENRGYLSIINQEQKILGLFPTPQL